MKPMCYVLLCAGYIILCMSCPCFVHRCAPLALHSFLHFSLFVKLSLFVQFSLFVLFSFYETIFSSSLYLTHFILPYSLRYHYYTCVIILYTCVCTLVLAVMASIVYNLNHLISSTLFFCFLQSSYRPVQSQNVGVFVILIMFDRIFFNYFNSYIWLVLVLI